MVNQLTQVHWRKQRVHFTAPKNGLHSAVLAGYDRFRLEPVTPNEISSAARRFRAWLNLWLDRTGQERQVLASALGVSKSAISSLLKEEGNNIRLPSGATLLAARHLFGGVSLDMLLLSDTPPLDISFLVPAKRPDSQAVHPPSPMVVGQTGTGDDGESGGAA